MNYKFYGTNGAEMEVKPNYETDQLSIWVQADFGENLIVLNSNDVEELYDALKKLKNNATNRNKIKNLLEIKKQKEWNNLSNN